MVRILNRMFWEEEGATAVEYGLLTALIALVMAVGTLSGCDALDPSVLAPPNSEVVMELPPRPAAETPKPPSKPRLGPREEDMQSIGPEESLRVYYQFTDDRGRVQFVERLDEVPTAWRDRVGYVEMAQAPPLTPAEARRSWRVSAERSAEIALAANSARSATDRRRMDDFSNSGVILYSATWCGYCTKARAHLDREGVHYEIRDVDIKAVSNELREKTGRGGVPVLDFGGEILRGYSSGQYDRAIRSIQG